MSVRGRREFLTAAGLLGSAALLPRPATAERIKTRLILLGTGGAPRPKKENNATAQVIVVNDALYVVDCGDGVARQLVLAGLSLDRLRHVFITHHHSDHNADYGNLLLLAWSSGLRAPVDTWGPPPLEKITRLFLEMSAYDIDIRINDEGRVPLVPLIHAHDLAAAGPVMTDENVTVRSALVDHPYMDAPVVAKRFFRFWFTGEDCCHTSGLCMRSEVAGPDGICWLMPDHWPGLLMSPGWFRLNQPRSDLWCHHFEKRLSNRW